MSNRRTAAQALRLAASSTNSRYVCKACRAQAARQFHTSTSNLAELPFYKRLANTLFGSKESREAGKSRDEKQRRRLEEVQTRADEGGGLEVKTGKNGRQYEVAAIVEASTRRDYVPATNWDGLERVGNTGWVKARADKGEQYVGFVPQKKVELRNKEWKMLLHHIMVEALVLQKAGRPAGQVCYHRAAGSKAWIHTRDATIQPSATGGSITVSLANTAAEQSILHAIPENLSGQQVHVQDEQASSYEVRSAVAEGGLAGQDAEGHSGSVPSPWMDVSIRDPTLKMALHKRILQLTGRRLTDPVISTSTTLSDLYNALRRQEKPKKLSQTPQLQRLKVEVPNVRVHSNRQTPIHKEKMVGRWKVIEEELMRRNLPVTGSRWQGAKAQYR